MSAWLLIAFLVVTAAAPVAIFFDYRAMAEPDEMEWLPEETSIFDV